MYSIHEYLPTVFGSYKLHIDHRPKKVTITELPPDIASFKNEIAVNSPKAPSAAAIEMKKRPSKSETHLTDHQSKLKEAAKRDVPPSYNIHFLNHTNQIVTEQPANVILIDGVTGADVTDAHAWMRSRPKRWNHILKLHEIENPEATNTQRRPPAVPEHVTIAKYGKKLLLEPHDMPHEQKGRNLLDKTAKLLYRPEEPPPKPFYKVDLARARHAHAQGIRDARDGAAKQRARRICKIMTLVNSRAQTAIARRDILPDIQTNGSTRTSVHLRRPGGKPRGEPIADDVVMSRRAEFAEDQIDYRNESERRVYTTNTYHYDDTKPPMAKDWNPREDQVLVNLAVLSRLEQTMPYSWRDDV